jgi:hypothetical protein
MSDRLRKSYLAACQPDGTYTVVIRDGGRQIGTIPGFPNMNAAIDECTRLQVLDEEGGGCKCCCND